MSDQHRCLKGTDVTRVAIANGLIVKNGKGSHTTVHGPAGRGYMTYTNGEMGRVLSSVVRNWFKQLGILLCIVFVLFILALIVVG